MQKPIKDSSPRGAAQKTNPPQQIRSGNDVPVSKKPGRTPHPKLAAAEALLRDDPEEAFQELYLRN